MFLAFGLSARDLDFSAIDPPKRLVHLGIDWSAATLADVPQVSKLLASVVPCADKVFA